LIWFTAPAWRPLGVWIMTPQGDQSTAGFDPDQSFDTKPQQGRLLFDPRQRNGPFKQSVIDCDSCPHGYTS